MRKYSNNRSGRIADQIHKDVVSILRYKVKDPRVKWLTINDVEVDSELAVAKVFWSILDDSRQSETCIALESAKGFIRSELSKGFRTYTVPQLRFVFDESLKRGSKILNILNKVREGFSDNTENNS